MSGEAKRICLGAFAGAHGVKGEVKIKTFTEAPENVAAYGPVTSEDGKLQFSLSFVKAMKDGFVLVRAKEIKTREDAEALKGVRLYVDRSVLPAPEEDEFYLGDLVGLAAVDEDGSSLGAVRAVYNFGAGDLLELADIPGVKGFTLVPFTKEAVPAIDLAAGHLTVARAALAGKEQGPTISDDTGQIVSDDIDVDLAAMREEDA